jgi:LysR family hydrogen peroxide-inducible transcriptional activator
MEIRHLTSLIAIADSGSFSAAARALGTVQSNVSAHISRLEADLGVTLVERHNGELTEDGARVVERARRVLHDLEDIADDIHSTDMIIEGEIRLGCIGTTARWLMPRLLLGLNEAHPHVHATVYEGATSLLVPRLLSGDLDGAIIHFPIDQPELALEPLFAEDLVLLVHSKHEWASRRSLSITELAQRPILLPPRSNALRRVLDRAAASHRVALQPQAEIDGMRLLASLAFEGFGPAVVPATAIPTWLTGDFARVSIPEMPRRVVGWATRRRPLPNRPTRATLEVAKIVIGETKSLPRGVHPDPASTRPLRSNL